MLVHQQCLQPLQERAVVAVQQQPLGPMPLIQVEAAAVEEFPLVAGLVPELF